MISVSYLKSICSKKETIKKIDESIADYIHVDLMDGIYVNNKNFTIEEVLNDLVNCHKKLDIHLMVQEPLPYIKDLINLNVWNITFHLDATKNPKKIIDYVKKHHINVGVAINPQDDIHIIDQYLNLIDYVLIMSVVPGLGGQQFMMEILEKVKYLEDKNVLIGIDGGINNITIKYLENYKIDNIVSGSYVCMSDNYNERINELKNIEI